jgi:hypothetical protein
MHQILISLQLQAASRVQFSKLLLHSLRLKINFYEHPAHMYIATGQLLGGGGVQNFRKGGGARCLSNNNKVRYRVHYICRLHEI